MTTRHITDEEFAILIGQERSLDNPEVPEVTAASDHLWECPQCLHRYQALHYEDRSLSRMLQSVEALQRPEDASAADALAVDLHLTLMSQVANGDDAFVPDEPTTVGGDFSEATEPRREWEPNEQAQSRRGWEPFVAAYFGQRGPWDDEFESAMRAMASARSAIPRGRSAVPPRRTALLRRPRLLALCAATLLLLVLVPTWRSATDNSLNPDESESVFVEPIQAASRAPALGTDPSTAAVVSGLANTTYIAQVRFEVKVRFRPPTVAARTTNPRTDVRFMVGQDGSVSDLTLIRRSGYPAYDLAAVRAISVAAAEHSLVASSSDASIALNVRFEGNRLVVVQQNPSALRNRERQRSP